MPLATVLYCAVLRSTCLNCTPCPAPPRIGAGQRIDGRSLTQKRSLVQSRYRPPAQRPCPIDGHGLASLLSDYLSDYASSFGGFRAAKIWSMATAPSRSTGRSWCRYTASVTRMPAWPHSSAMSPILTPLTACCWARRHGRGGPLSTLITRQADAASQMNPSGSVKGPASLPMTIRCDPVPSCSTPASLAAARRL